MGVVMIRCPATEKVISTGICIDSAAFHSMPVFFGTLCRIAHEWSAASAWVCDAAPRTVTRSARSAR